jgi:CRP/FNR family transcriptional regulator, cyclic AMP receptor protein
VRTVTEVDERSWVPRGVRLLDADPDLGAGLSPQEREQALAHAVFPTLALETGPWRIEQLRRTRGVRGEVHGFIVLEGLVTMRMEVIDRICTRLIPPPSVVFVNGAPAESVPLRWGWHVLESARLAILDARTWVLAARWPAVMGELMRRSAHEVAQAQLQQAISQLPRVEDRLLALLWLLADHVGTVRQEGVLIQLQVTHDTLAEMIGARRPTVSLGLRELARDGLVTPQPHGWLLAPGSSERLTAAAAPGLDGSDGDEAPDRREPPV